MFFILSIGSSVKMVLKGTFSEPAMAGKVISGPVMITSVLPFIVPPLFILP